MLEKLKKLEKKANLGLKSCNSVPDLEEWKIKFLGRKSELSLILKDIKNIDVSLKKEVGMLGNKLRIELETLYNNHLESLEPSKKEQNSSFDHFLPGREVKVGKLHPVTQTLREIKKAFSSLGFQVAEGPEIEWDKYNFDMLNIPEDHPARDMWDTMWIDEKMNSNGEKMLLRTHTSPVQARIMESQDPPIRVIVPGKCYRYEATDATHEWHFYQVEGLAVDKNLTFADLKGTLYEFAKKIFGNDTKIRFRCDYFPFVEPGVDMSIFWEGKWLEILGAGMVHPKVFEKAGYTDPNISGFAFGMGPERIAMIKHNIDDIRLFYSNDLRFLNQF